MLDIQDSAATLVTGLWTPLAVALITAAASVAIALMSTRADDLKRAERLSQVLTGMEESPERVVVSTIRDDYAVSWALRQAAPVNHALRILVFILTMLGGIALAGAILVGIYVGLGYGVVSDWFFWVYYSVGLLMLIGAGGLRANAARRARLWVQAERSWRGLRMPLHHELRFGADDNSHKPIDPSGSPAGKDAPQS